MAKLKNSLKKQFLKFVERYIGKRVMLNEFLSPIEKQAINLIHHGFLHDIGWWKSWETKAPIDSNNNPLPWVTYSFIKFIENRLRKDMILFEFGSGNSTLYYSENVKEVHTVEHNPEWFERTSLKIPENVLIENIHSGIGGQYSMASSNKGIKYDIIIVDGIDRVNCILNSIENLKNNGVLILDDSEREEYRAGVNELFNLGFKSIDLWGISPGFISYNKCTSIYYRNENILGI